MTVQEIKTLFAFNSWATNRIFEALEKVAEQDYKRDLKASHGSLHGTMTHLVAAERIWLSRLVGKPETSLVTEQDLPSLGALKTAWEDIASRTARFVGKLDEQKLQTAFEYTTTSGKKFANTHQQILQHLVNHSSYHRGQIAAMMRQVGAEPVSTDLIAFYRHSAQNQ
ncbi:MAG TPA: DinB family protein [Acidobacteriota bacterium]|nr:DinB family protein [Acidobacteriota bacterium]